MSWNSFSCVIRRSLVVKGFESGVGGVYAMDGCRPGLSREMREGGHTMTPRKVYLLLVRCSVLKEVCPS